MKIYIVVTDVVNDVTYSSISVSIWWSYFYDMTLSTGKQRRHMIKVIIHLSKTGRTLLSECSALMLAS